MFSYKNVTMIKCKKTGVDGECSSQTGNDCVIMSADLRFISDSLWILMLRFGYWKGAGVNNARNSYLHSPLPPVIFIAA
jgi:hypothetical protein